MAAEFCELVDVDEDEEEDEHSWTELDIDCFIGVKIDVSSKYKILVLDQLNL